MYPLRILTSGHIFQPFLGEERAQTDLRGPEAREPGRHFQKVHVSYVKGQSQDFYFCWLGQEVFWGRDGKL